MRPQAVSVWPAARDALGAARGGLPRSTSWARSRTARSPTVGSGVVGGGGVGSAGRHQAGRWRVSGAGGVVAGTSAESSPGHDRTPPPPMRRGPVFSGRPCRSPHTFRPIRERRVPGRHTERQPSRPGRDRTPSPPATGSCVPDRCSPAVRQVGSRPSRSRPPIVPSPQAPRRYVVARSPPTGPPGGRAGRRGSSSSAPITPSAVRSAVMATGRSGRSSWMGACMPKRRRTHPTCFASAQ